MNNGDAQRETPETDAILSNMGLCSQRGRIAKLKRHARSLERRLAKMAEERDFAVKQLALELEIPTHLLDVHAIAEQRDHAVVERDALKAENAELKAWKESAQAVEREWDAQAIAEMLGATLGSSVRKAIAKRVPEILAENAELKKKLKA